MLGGLSLTQPSNGNYTKALATLPGPISWKPPTYRDFYNLKIAEAFFSLVFFRYPNLCLNPLVILGVWFWGGRL